MKKLSILSILGLSLVAPVTLATTTLNAQTASDYWGVYALFHPQLENLDIKSWSKTIDADYRDLFTQNKLVNQTQYVRYELQRLEPVIHKRREASLKQAYVRFGILDSNKDQKITLKEFQAIGLKTFANFDKNDDGIINADDSQLNPEQQGTHDGLRIKTPLSMPMANSIPEFIELYAEGKSYVTLADYLISRDKQFLAVDKNHDLGLSEQEYVDEFMQRYDDNLATANLAYQTIFAAQFQAIAQNKALIKLNHIKKYTKLVFNSKDVDGNGIIEKKEL